MTTGTTTTGGQPMNEAAADAIETLIDALAVMAAEDYLRSQAAPANDSAPSRPDHVPLQSLPPAA